MTDTPTTDKLAKFKNSGWGSWLSRALFLEQYYTSNDDNSLVLYSLQAQDRTVQGKTYPSIIRLYVELGDLTEYLFANKYFGGWDHWQHLCECEWFKPYLSKMRTELELKIQAEALQRMMDEALSDGRNAFQVNRFLVSKGWVSDRTPHAEERRGRPSKDEIRKAAIDQASRISKAEEDLKRITELN